MYPGAILPCFVSLQRRMYAVIRQTITVTYIFVPLLDTKGTLAIFEVASITCLYMYIRSYAYDLQK